MGGALGRFRATGNGQAVPEMLFEAVGRVDKSCWES